MKNLDVLNINLRVVEESAKRFSELAYEEFFATTPDIINSDTLPEEESEKLTMRLNLWEGINDKAEQISQLVTELKVLLGMLN